MSEEQKDQSPPVEDLFQNLFSSSVSGGGEEELLKIASSYALQLSAAQIRALLRLEMHSRNFLRRGKKEIAENLHNFVTRWIELKRNNNSDAFVMRALDAISLRRLIGENAVKVDIQK